MATPLEIIGSQYGLVELILQHLEPRTLLFAQRQALFMSPMHVVNGPLKASSACGDFGYITGYDCLKMSNGYTSRDQVVFKNPFMQPWLDHLANAYPIAEESPLPEPFLRPEASWQRMILTQPPILTTIAFGYEVTSLRVLGSPMLQSVFAAFLASVAREGAGLTCRFGYGFKMKDLKSARQLDVVEAELNSHDKLHV